MPETFVKPSTDRTCRFPTSVRHNGTVLAFAMDDRRRIRYTVLDLGEAMLAGDAVWGPSPSELAFASELTNVKLGRTTPVVPGTARRDDDWFLSSTARLTAGVPFQVLSDGLFVYVFRQAITDPTPADLDAALATVGDPGAVAADVAAAARDVVTDHERLVYVLDERGAPVLDEFGRPVPLVSGTLLVDRFVLVGDRLQSKLEVRYRRSRSTSQAKSSEDSLGAADLEGNVFVEPTHALTFVPALSAGRFSALLVPTRVANVYQWQIFAVHAGDGLVWSYNIERSADGLFNTFDTQDHMGVDHSASDAFAMLDVA